MYSFRYYIFYPCRYKMFIFKLIIMFHLLIFMIYIYIHMHRFLMIYKSFYFLIYKLWAHLWYSKLLFFSIQHTSLCFIFLLLLVETVYSKQSQNFLFLRYLWVKEISLKHDSILSNFSLSYSSPQQFVKRDISISPLLMCLFIMMSLDTFNVT